MRKIDLGFLIDFCTNSHFQYITENLKLKESSIIF